MSLNVNITYKQAKRALPEMFKAREVYLQLKQTEGGAKRRNKTSLPPNQRHLTKHFTLVGPPKLRTPALHGIRRDADFEVLELQKIRTGREPNPKGANIYLW